MSEPVTIEDWETMLMAFKEEEGAEAPLMIGSNGIIDGGNTIGSEQDEGYFISAYGILSEFYQKDGVVMYGPVQPEYKEYLTLMNDWYQKGLIDPNFMSNSAGTFVPLDYAATGKAGAGREHFILTADYCKINGLTDDEDFFIEGVQAPVLNEGEVAQARNVNNPVREAYAISTNCENVELAVRWLDYQYTRDALLLNYYGVEGETYTINPDTGIAEYNDWVLNNPDGYTPVDAHYLVGRGQGVGAFDYTKEYQVQSSDYFEAGKTWAKDGTSLKLPDKMSMTAEEGSNFNSSYIDIQTCVQENTVKFITGARSLDEFDDFVNEIKAMDIDYCISLKQAALDRYNAR
jgi:putative aldouronate transport system substrate-binding protein